jgi:hypothetical protein
MKYWVWEYEENPLGKVIWVVEHNDHIVAQMGLIRVDLKVGGKIFKSVIYADAMTHPNFRRRGLQRAIEAQTENELVKAGIYFSYWFPGEIFRNHGRHGVDYIYKLPVLVKFFDTDETIRKLIGSSFFSKVLSLWLSPIMDVLFRPKKEAVIEGVKITKIAQFDDRINDFWKNVSRYFDIIVVKNREYLNWRYFQRPNSNLNVLLAEDDSKILGYIVFSSRSRDKRGFIVDLLVYPHRLDVIQNLVSMAVKQLRKEKVNMIICLMLENNPYHKILRANGFIPISSRFVLGISIYFPSRVPSELVKNPNNWYLTLGDTDGININ